jgi:NAD(P)-dependent dehydrogenase (short-subunit alcohol dehydrogenase family)
MGVDADIAVQANYVASKPGLVGFTRQLAREYATDHMRANVIATSWHGDPRLGCEVERDDARVMHLFAASST